jgi:heme exporter protein CcmD
MRRGLSTNRPPGRLPMNHDPHFGSVIAAYALAFVVLGGMIGAVVIDYLRLKRALSMLSAPLLRHHSPGESNRNELNAQATDVEGLE